MVPSTSGHGMTPSSGPFHLPYCIEILGEVWLGFKLRSQISVFSFRSIFSTQLSWGGAINMNRKNIGNIRPIHVQVPGFNQTKILFWIKYVGLNTNPVGIPRPNQFQQIWVVKNYGTRLTPKIGSLVLTYETIHYSGGAIITMWSLMSKSTQIPWNLALWPFELGIPSQQIILVRW